MRIRLDPIKPCFFFSFWVTHRRWNHATTLLILVSSRCKQMPLNRSDIENTPHMSTPIYELLSNVSTGICYRSMALTPGAGLLQKLGLHAQLRRLIATEAVATNSKYISSYCLSVKCCHSSFCNLLCKNEKYFFDIKYYSYAKRILYCPKKSSNQHYF